MYHFVIKRNEDFLTRRDNLCSLSVITYVRAELIIIIIIIYITQILQ
jgi:hypothetical protein